MNKTVIPLNGRLNKDANPLFIDSESGEVIVRENCRVVSLEGGRLGINVSLKGMQQILANLPSGTNKFIGFVEDKERDRSLVFNYNSNGDDSIYVLDNDTITDLDFDNGVLGFASTEIIDADILGDYCVFVSDENPPRKIDIVTSAWATGKDAYDIQLAVRPPSEKPTTVLGSDATRVVNKLVGKTFQFAYMYFYEDYTYSVLSPYSDIVVSSSV